MNEFKAWALSLAAGIILAGVVAALSPRGSMLKTLKIAAGIFIISIICSPLARLKKFDGAKFFASDFREESYEDASDSLRDGLVRACRSAAEETIRSAAEELGIKLDGVAADLHIEDDGCVIIDKITIYVSGSSDAASEELSRIVSERLLAPVSVETE